MTVPGNAEIITGRFMLGMRWATFGISLTVLFGLQLPKLFASSESYRPIWVQFLVLAVLVGVTLYGGVLTWLRKPFGLAHWPLVALLLVTSVVATLTVVPVDRLGTPHWSDEGIGWPLVILMMDRRLRVFAALLAVHYAAEFAVVLLDGQARVTFAGVVNSTMITSAFQVAIVLFANALRRVAVGVAEVAVEEERLRTAEAVADQLHTDRKERYAALAETTAPLLAGLVSGALDPGDESVRRSCAIEAGRMRRLFGESAIVPDPLVHELMACVGLAERNGVSVRFSERGERRPVPTAVRRMLTEPAVAVLATARGDVRLTVVGAGEKVTVSIVANSPPHAVPTVDSDEITTATVLTGDRLWVQATWEGVK
jgi:hypothetical protein